jgi:hypothetical protein
VIIFAAILVGAGLAYQYLRSRRSGVRLMDRLGSTVDEDTAADAHPQPSR